MLRILVTAPLLGEDHTDGLRLHQLLLELIRRAKKDLSARQAKALLAKVRGDAAGNTRRRVAED